MKEEPEVKKSNTINELFPVNFLTGNDVIAYRACIFRQKNEIIASNATKFE